MTQLRFGLALVLSSLSLACEPETEEVTATASETGGSSTGDGATASSADDGTDSASTVSSDSATTVDTVTTDATSSEDGSGSETGVVSACRDATDEAACQGVATTDCGWFPTTYQAFMGDQTCGDLGLDEGFCLEIDPSGECSSTIPTCPDGRAVLYRVAGLEVGAVELLVFEDTTLCEVPDGFASCQVNSEPKPGSEPSYFPLECECACTAS